MANSVVGVEIAEESVRAVQVTRGLHPQLIAAGEVMLPAGSARDSDVLDTEAVADALSQLWSQAHLTKRKAVVALANRRILVRDYTAPNLPPDELAKALRYETQDLLPVPVDEAVLDFYPRTVEGSQAKGLLVAGPADNVESILDALSKAKVRTDTVDFLPFGLARIAGRVVPQGFGPVAVVAIGEHLTSFVVALDGIPCYVRFIAVDVMPGMRLANATPSRISVEDSAPGRRTLSSDAGSDPTVTELIDRLSETLTFCRRQDQCHDPRQLLLTGAVAQTADLAQVVAEKLQIDVRVVQPADVISIGTKLAGTELPSSLMGALGVTLDGGN